MVDAQASSLSNREHSFAILVRYVLFAIVAGVTNLLTQWIVFGLVPVQPLATSILTGTAVGFIVKYFLDKRWIFFAADGGVRQEVYRLFLYGTFSVVMTLVFWAFEISFLAIGGTDLAKYAGAVIGLAIGNFTKYLLDRSFTFDQKA